MRSLSLGLTLALIAALIATALMLVHSKHQARRLFVELQELQRERDSLNIDWGRLQLEQSSWASHGRVERIARHKLVMALPKPDQIVFIKP